MLLPVSTSLPPANVKPPVPPMLPAKLPDAFESVSVWAPSATVPPATPERLAIVAPAVVPEISKTPAAPPRLTPLDAAMLPVPLSTSVPALIVVRPV